jgi:membrane AbrB-like protein
MGDEPREFLSMSPILRQALALAIGLLSGYAAHLINMPLAWMLGPMIGCTAAALMQAPILAPMKLRPWVMPVIGVLLGSRISVDVLAAAAGWWVTAVLLLPFLVVTAAVSYWFYRRIGGYDRPTAFFSAMPGGLTDMIIMGGAVGGDERKISLAHATRVLIVICGVVLFYTWFIGVTSDAAQRTWVGLDALGLWDWVVLAACAVFGVPLGKVVNLPAGQIMGPMILSGIAHVTGVVAVAPPSLIVIVALVVMGTTIGCRFVGSTLHDVGRDIMLGGGSAALMIAIAVGFAGIVTWGTGAGISETFLAYSPGGVVEMSLLALAMGQDVTYVTVMHLLRIFIVIFGSGYGYRLVTKLRRSGRSRG